MEGAIYILLLSGEEVKTTSTTWLGALLFVLAIGVVGVYLSYKDKRP